MIRARKPQFDLGDSFFSFPAGRGIRWRTFNASAVTYKPIVSPQFTMLIIFLVIYFMISDASCHERIKNMYIA